MPERWRNDLTKQAVISAMFSYDQIIFFDTETTSLSAKKGRIIELAAIKCEIGEGTAFSEIDRLHVYINPNMLLPEKITGLTGITNEMLRNEPNEGEIFCKIRSFFDNGPVLVAYNVDFDLEFLTQMYLRNDAILGERVTIDVLEMARDALDIKQYNLESVANELGLTADGNYHSAMTDVEIMISAFRLFWNGYFTGEEKSEMSKQRPTVYRIRFWEGYKGFSRIYVETSAGAVYYDVRRKCWANKDANFNSLDLAYVEQKAWKLAGVTNQNDFSKYKGSKARMS